LRRDSTRCSPPCRHHPPDARLPRRDIHISCEVEQPDGGPGPWFELWIDDRYELSSRWLWRCEDRVLGRLNRWTLDATPDRLHLHAGLVSRNDHAVLVVGPSGAGKSTLVAALVLDGWTYHTDEMIGIDLATGALHGHPRALTLKPGSWGLFELPTLRDARRMPSRARAHLPPGELGGASSDAIESCTTIVFVRPGNAWPALETMAPVQAAAGLMAESLDAERAGPAGMQRIVELASTTPSFSLTTGELDATVGLLRPALTGERRSPVSADRFGPPLSGSASAFHAAVLGWAIGNAGLLYDTNTGTLLQLDHMGAETSRLLFSSDRSTPS